MTGERPLGGRYYEAIRETKKAIVTQALRESHGNIMKAAAWLGVDRNLVYKLMLEFEISRPNAKRSERSEA